MQQEIWFHKYRILGLLGKGGNAEVFLAEHIKLNSFRAIKFISKNHPLYNLQCKEALILKNLKHSCIPIVYDIEEDEYGSYIVEQYLEGETLKSYVSTRKYLRDYDIIHFALQICDLINYLHSVERPILYVDLKPENILLYGKTLKLVDFGSAVFTDELREGQPYLATPGYAAPELYRDSRIDERSEIYGIGMLMYYMATGQNVQSDSGIYHIDQVGQCSKQMMKVINRCLKYNPSQRYNSIAGLNRELSAMIRINQYQPESSQAVTIAVAGAQARIGVTHLAIRLCKYFIRQGYQCLYQEVNNSEDVRSIRNRYEGVCMKGGVSYIKGIPMLDQEQRIGLISENYQYRILDFGCLNQDNLSKYMETEIKFIILGAKDWELKYAEQIIQMTSEYKDIIYLFNFVDGRQFEQIVHSMERRSCFRIPYEPDPYSSINQKNGLDFFQNLLRSVKRPVHRNLADLSKKGLFL